MNSDIEKLYQKIGDLLVAKVEGGFNQAWIYVEMMDDTGNVSVYYEKSDGILWFYASNNGLEAELYYAFDQMRKLWRKESEPWSTAGFTLNSKNKFEIDFDYIDVSDPGLAIERRKNWEKKQFVGKKVNFSGW